MFSLVRDCGLFLILPPLGENPRCCDLHLQGFSGEIIIIICSVPPRLSSVMQILTN